MNKNLLNTIALGAVSLNSIHCGGVVTSGHRHGSLFELLDSDGFLLYDSEGYELLVNG